MSGDETGSYTRSGKQYNQNVTNVSPIVHDNILNVGSNVNMSTEQNTERDAKLNDTNALPDEELTTENDENTVVKQLSDDSSHKIEEFKSGQIPSATHQPSFSYHNYDSQLNPDWKIDIEEKFQDCQEAIKSSDIHYQQATQELHDLIQSESLANQSRFRHERDQDMHLLREVIQSHLNQEIEGVHSRVKEWTTKEAEAQARTHNVLLQHIDKVSHTPQVEKSANSFGDMGQVRFDTFSGKQSEDFAKFRKAVQRNFEFLEWDADRRARFLPTLLTNKALRVYETLAPNITTDIDAVWRALDEHFSQKSKGYCTYTH